MTFELELQSMGWKDQSNGNRKYPYFYWLSSTLSDGFIGKFHTSEKQFPEGIFPPWEECDRFENDGVNYETSSLRIVPIRWKQQPFIDTTDKDTGKKTRTWYAHYKKNMGMSFYTEILCFIEGSDSLCLLTAKGLVGAAFTKAGSGIISKHQELIHGEAKKTAKVNIAPFAFWVPICAPKDSKGKLVLTDTGYKSKLVLPKLDIDETNINRQTLIDLFIGKEMLAKCEQAWKDSAAWQTEKYKNEVDEPIESPGRNEVGQLEELQTEDDDSDSRPF